MKRMTRGNQKAGIAIVMIWWLGMGPQPIAVVTASDNRLSPIHQEREADGPERAEVVTSASNTPATASHLKKLSVSPSRSALAFASQPPNSWLAPDSSYLRNDGTKVEDLRGKISVFVAGLATWALSASANGPDAIRAQWSTASNAGPWNNIAAYDVDFGIITGLAASDSVQFFIRIQTPTTSTSNGEYSSTLTVTAVPGI